MPIHIFRVFSAVFTVLLRPIAKHMETSFANNRHPVVEKTFYGLGLGLYKIKAISENISLNPN